MATRTSNWNILYSIEFIWKPVLIKKNREPYGWNEDQFDKLSKSNMYCSFE